VNSQENNADHYDYMQQLSILDNMFVVYCKNIGYQYNDVVYYFFSFIASV